MRIPSVTHRYGAWDQLVFNEELSFNEPMFRDLTCCHTQMLLCAFEHREADPAQKSVREVGARPCLAPNDPATPSSLPPPNGTRNRWAEPWHALGFNTLHISLRRFGRCTAMSAACQGWAGPTGAIKSSQQSLPAAVGSRCECF